MDKLFDLMVMGVKYCLVCSTSLEDILQVCGANSLWPARGNCRH